MSPLQRIGWGMILGAAGLLLNLVAVEVLPGVHLLLGPLAVLASAALLGPLGGGVAGAIAGTRTLWLWGHPWGWLNMALEGLLVGLLRRHTLPISADALFWLLSPLYFFLTYHLLADIPAEATVVAAVKQAVNGLLAALAIQVLLLLPIVRRSARHLLPPPLSDVPLGRVFSSALALGAVIPLLLVGGSEGRARYLAEVQRVDEENTHAAQAVTREIERSITRSLQGTSRLAHALAGKLSPEGALPAQAILEAELDALVAYSPEMINAYVGSPEGVALAFSPRTDNDGRPLTGSDFSDRDYVKAIRGSPEAIVSDVFVGRGGVSGPVVVTVAPVRLGSHFAGYVTSALNMNRLQQYARQVQQSHQRALVIDGRRNVVFDSATESGRSLQSIVGTPLEQALSQVRHDGIGAYASQAEPRTLIRAGSMHNFGVVEVRPLGWKVVVEQPTAQLQRGIERAYFSLLITMGLATVAAVLVAFTLSRAIVSPVQRVSHAAAQFAQGIRTARTDVVALDAPQELRQLAQTFDWMADQLTRQFESFERTSREKDAFLSIASHELKTPLTALKAQVQLLRRKVGDAHADRLDVLNRQIDRVTRLVNQLLDASQLGLEQLPLQRSRVDLGEVASRVAESLVNASPLHTLQLDTPSVVGELDEMRVEQVVHNLVANAIKYSPTGGLIEIRVRRLPDGEAELEVADRGIGLRAEDEEQLFGRFERGNRQELAGISGLGVGLYISREIVRRHGGRISLHPREGGGAVARAVLPLGGRDGGTEPGLSGGGDWIPP